MRTRSGMGVLVILTGLIASAAAAAPPKGKPAKSKSAAPLPALNADVLRAGTFNGVLVSPPNSDRMITIKVTYPEVRLKPGAKAPNFRSMEAKTMHQIMQEMHRAQQMPHSRGGYRGGGRGHHYHPNAFANMMHMQQMYMQGEQRMAQAMVRAQQQEYQLLQREIQAIRNMYQVVQATRDVDFQLTENVKVRTKNVPQQFDEKGEIKKYTREELAVLKGKDKNLMGYESSLEALQQGQTLLLALRVHKKPKPAKLTTTTNQKDKEEQPVETTDASLEHKMQVTVVVIVKDSDAPQSSSAKPKKKKK
ncbi:MAG TPA: hypothetical protein VMG10_02215 [Gemmataceae bacterium]|nr:hypothetical protein [Gemmataceae bacterium]